MITKPIRTLSCLVVLAIHAGGGWAWAQTSSLTYQGFLGSNGTAVAGAQDVIFRLFQSASGGLPTRSVTNLNVAVTGGLFTTTLNFGADVFNGADYWLELSVRPAGAGAFVTLSPRQALTAQPYAIYAGNVAQVTGGGIIDPTFLGNTGPTPLEFQVNGQAALRLEPDPTPAAGNLHSYNLVAGYAGNVVDAGVRGATISGGGSADNFGLPVFDLPNLVNGDFGTIAGGLGNTVLGFAGTISGGLMNVVAADQANIGGGDMNQIFLEATSANIAGGQGNSIRNRAVAASIGGGSLNLIENDSQMSGIAGGSGNRIGANSVGAFLGGGQANTIDASATSAVLGGGQSNSNGASLAFLGGGQGNFISSIAVGSSIVGGSRNSIELGAEGNTIGGGSDNLIGISSDHCTIGGGSENVIDTTTFNGAIGGGDGNRVDRGANSATISGGFVNRILENALGAAIGGGLNNTNAAPYSTIPGGRNNFALGETSFAAGRRAKALHPGAFVWGDNADDDVTSAAANQFTARAAGGYRLYSNTNLTSGVILNPGSGSWSMASDRNIKENIERIDATEVLNRLSALPIQSWNYKTQSDQVRHIGPMAQDFHAAFGLGEDDRHISSVDADGVALAAIQGLHEMLKEKEAQIRRLEAALDELKALVGTMRKDE